MEGHLQSYPSRQSQCSYDCHPQLTLWWESGQIVVVLNCAALIRGGCATLLFDTTAQLLLRAEVVYGQIKKESLAPQ